jgi:hypothetical protein
MTEFPRPPDCFSIRPGLIETGIIEREEKGMPLRFAGFVDLSGISRIKTLHLTFWAVPNPCPLIIFRSNGILVIPALFFNRASAP